MRSQAPAPDVVVTGISSLRNRQSGVKVQTIFGHNLNLVGAARVGSIPLPILAIAADGSSMVVRVQPGGIVLADNQPLFLHGTRFGEPFVWVIRPDDIPSTRGYRFGAPQQVPSGFGGGTTGVGYRFGAQQQANVVHQATMQRGGRGRLGSDAYRRVAGRFQPAPSAGGGGKCSPKCKSGEICRKDPKTGKYSCETLFTDDDQDPLGGAAGGGFGYRGAMRPRRLGSDAYQPRFPGRRRLRRW